MKAPQSSGMSNKDGTVSERLIRYYRNQASGGAGMIIVEYAYVDDIGAKSAHCHLGISQNEHIPGLTWLAENIKECGAAAGIQIEHCGRQKFLGTQPMCAPMRHPLAEVVGSVRLAGRAPRADHRGDPGHSPRLRRRCLAREGRPASTSSRSTAHTAIC